MELMAEKMRLAVLALGMEHAGNDAHGVVTISIGAFSMVPATNASLSAVIESADQALYLAKTGGRNRLVVTPS